MEVERLEDNFGLTLVELTPVLVPYFIGFFIFRGFYANFPIYLQLLLGLSETETVEMWSVIGGIGLVVGGLTRLPAGLVSDRLGRKNAFALAYVVYVISLLLLLLYPITPVFVLSISLIRSGVNLFAMSGRAVVSQSKRDKGVKNGLLSSMVGLGGFAGPYLLAYILDNFGPQSIVVVALGLVLTDALLFLLALWLIPWALSRFYGGQVIDINLLPVRSNLMQNLQSGIRRPGVLESVFLFFTAGLNYGLITTVFTIYGYNVLGMDLTTLGLVTGVGPLIQVAWAPITGKLYQYVRDELMRIMAWSLILLASFLMIFSFVSPAFFIAGYMVLHFGNASYLTMEITRLGMITKKEEFSVIFGLTTTFIILANALASYLSPPLYAISSEGTFVTGLFVSVISFVTVLITTRKWSELRERSLQS